MRSFLGSKNISNYDSEEFVVLSSMQNNYCASQLSDLL